MVSEHRRRLDDLKRAVDAYSKATELDPTYADPQLGVHISVDKFAKMQRSRRRWLQSRGSKKIRFINKELL
jgi:hypothetical protein